MKKHSLKLAIAASAMTLIFAGCGDDVLVSEEVSQAFTTVSELDKDDCNSKSEGSMAFVKSESTMYVCTDGEWIALKDEDAIEYRCTTKSVKKDGKTGIEIVCDGESIGVVYNGEKGDDGQPGKNGRNGDSVDMDELNDLINKSIADGLDEVSKDLSKQLSSASAKNKNDLEKQLDEATEEMGKDLDSKLSSASAKNQNDTDRKISSATDKLGKDIDSKVSSASAKHDQDVKDLNSKLSSAAAKHDQDVKDLNSKLSSASAKQDKDNQDLDQKLSSLADEYDKSCKIINVPETDENDKVIAVTVKCGTAEKEFVINLEDENLKNVYKKHVVVRFPVHATKETQTDDIYEEIWKNLKGGDNAALTVMDLDDKLNANGKMFVKDLFATARKSFVTVEETNGKVVEYKVVRLEGDLEVTNMSTPIAQLRVKLNLQNAVGFNLATTEVIYNALVDLTDSDPNVEDASDTVVIDFLTDYKAERVKTLAKGDAAKFEEASAQANEELAKALAMDAFEDNQIKAFEHYLPGEKEVGLNEYFNSIVWVMALIDQNDKIPNFNKIYTEFRSVFAENGDFNKSIKTVYAGRQHDMYFVDYLALLIDANFYKWSCGWNCLSNLWRDTDAPYYKILQKGFVSAYGLDVSKTKEIVANNTEVKNGTSTRIQKIESANGYFRYFEYLESKKVWIPADALTDRIAAFEVGQCKTTIDKKTYFHTFEGVDRNVICKCSENSGCDWIETDVCVGRQEGDRGYHYVNGMVEAYVCVKDGCGEESSCESLISVNPESLSSSSSNASSSSYVSEEEENIKLAEKLANDKNSSLYLGKCSMENDGKTKEFDKDGAVLATTTGYVTMVCEGKKKWWRVKTEFEYQFGLCNETVMNKAELKHGVSDWYKCDYKDKEQKYEWVGTSWYEYGLLKTVCHYGIAERKTYDEQGNVTGVENEGKIVEYEDGNGGVKYYICRTEEDYTDVPGNHIHDWDVAGPDDYFGECNVDVMKEQTTFSSMGVDEYKCDCEAGETEGSYTNCGWVKPSNDEENKESLLSKPCTENLVGEIYTFTSGSSTATLVCKKINDGSKQMREATKEEALGSCSVEIMQTQVGLKSYNGTKFKCDCPTVTYHEWDDVQYTFDDCDWLSASTKDVELNDPCTAYHAWNDVKKISKAPKENVYYCKGESVDNVRVHDWANMTGAAWCSNHWRYTKFGSVEHYGTIYASAICVDNPVDGKTYFYSDVSGGASIFNAEQFFAMDNGLNNDVDCSNSKKYISSLLNYESDELFENGSVNFYKYEDVGDDEKEYVHDFVCKDGKLVEAIDEQDACNAAFEKTEICAYMKNAYKYDLSDELWKLYTAEEYCNAKLKDATTLSTCSPEEVNQNWTACYASEKCFETTSGNKYIYFEKELPSALQNDGQTYCRCSGNLNEDGTNPEDYIQWRYTGA